jgi:hypothetical protein
MSTRIDSVEAAPAPRAIRIRLAAAIGLMLLAIGLAVGLIVGGPPRPRRPRRLPPPRSRRSAGRMTTAPATRWPRRSPLR